MRPHILTCVLCALVCGCCDMGNGTLSPFYPGVLLGPRYNGTHTEVGLVFAASSISATVVTPIVPGISSPPTPTGRDGASTNTPVVLTTFFFTVDSRLCQASARGRGHGSCSYAAFCCRESPWVHS